jgi:hypothetical protein
VSLSDRQLQPAYEFLADEMEFTLARGDAQITVGDDTFDGDGRALLQVSPQPRVLLKAHFGSITPHVAIAASLGAMITSSSDASSASTDSGHDLG